MMDPGPLPTNAAPAVWSVLRRLLAVRPWTTAQQLCTQQVDKGGDFEGVDVAEVLAVYVDSFDHIKDSSAAAVHGQGGCQSSSELKVESEEQRCPSAAASADGPAGREDLPCRTSALEADTAPCCTERWCDLVSCLDLRLEDDCPWAHARRVWIEPFTTVAALAAALAAAAPPGSELVVRYEGMWVDPGELEDEDLPAEGNLRAMAVPPAGPYTLPFEELYALEHSVRHWMHCSDDAAPCTAHHSSEADASFEGTAAAATAAPVGGAGTSGADDGAPWPDDCGFSDLGSSRSSLSSIESIDTWHRILKHNTRFCFYPPEKLGCRR